jgi:integrase
MKRQARGLGSVYWSESKSLWVGKITLADGKRKVKYSKSQKVVKDWIVEAREAQRKGILASDDSTTLGEFMNNYMENVGKHTLRPKTIESYSSLIRIHILPVLGKVKLVNLRPDHLQSLYSSRLEIGLSRRTVHYIHSILHRALDQAMKWGLVHRNVADLVKAPSPQKRQLTVWDKYQVNTFLGFTRDRKFGLVYQLCVLGGFREGEVLGIRKSDVDLSRGTITVNQAVQYLLGKGVTITQPKTSKSRRSVTLPPSLLPALKEYIEGLEGNQLLFTTSSGKPINPRFLIKHFKDDLKACGLPEIRFHDLRHTSATLLLSANVHPKIVQERLGHSSITLTLDTYSHVTKTMQDEAAEKLDGLLSNP